MDRQKPRVNGSIDGFMRADHKPRYFIDGVSQQSHKQPLRPAAYDGPLTSSSIRPQPIVRPGINRPVPNRPPIVNDLNGQTRPEVQRAQSLVPRLNDRQPASLIGTSLPTNGITRRPLKTRKSKWRSPKRIALSSTLVLVIGLIGFGLWFGSSLLSSVNKVFHGNVFSDANALINGTNLKESGGRINILLAGDSVGDPNHGGATLADSIMVLSFDPQTKTGFILSVPRDLWVYIPSMGHQKINATNDVVNFSQPGYPSGGMGQLEQVLNTDLGIPIDYYALIDYAAFKDAVNAVGGITINIQSPDPRGIYDAYTHLKLPNGWVTLSGQQALDLARARGDGAAGDVSYGLPNSDFSRTQHQRQMLVALFKKASSIGVLSNPLKVTSLFNAFSSNISTDMTIGDVIALEKASSGVDLTKLQSVTYSYGGINPLLKGYVDPVSGQDALIPSLGLNNFTQLKNYYQQLTSSNPVVQEGPTVTLLNASNVSGLASKEKMVLENKGYTVTSIADASTEYPSTLIVNNTNGQKPAATTAISKLIKGNVTTTTTGSKEAAEAANYTTDYVIVMGQDWNNSKPNATPVQN